MENNNKKHGQLGGQEKDANQAKKVGSESAKAGQVKEAGMHKEEHSKDAAKTNASKHNNDGSKKHVA